MIKKVLVALFVAVTFVIYSIHQRNEGNAAVAQVTKSNGSTGNTTTVPTTTNQPSSTTSNSTYRDGTYKGSQADAFYGYIQVQVVVSSGKISDVAFLEYPNDRRNSVEINDYAMPILKQQAISSQSAKVEGVSGATDTSQAFIQSLGDALSQAKV